MENSSNSSLGKKLQYSFELIKFSHTIFALPFALIAFFVASKGNISWPKALWVVFCVVCARTAAMAFNRLVDANIDARNPRTASRHLPSGLLSRSFVIFLTLIASTAFIFGTSQLNQTALWLSPIALLVLFFYSLTKRFTHFTQFFLGLSLGMAPIGAAIAVNGTPSLSAWVLGIAVLFWVAGFDLLYALQDFEFDQREGLHSLTIKLGVKNSFRLSALFHLVFLILLFFYGKLTGLGTFYWLGVGLSGLLLAWQHLILKEDLRRINAAFFTANGLLSFILLAATCLDLSIRSS